MTFPVSLLNERVARRSFTASDVLACVGITYRQLDYWTRTGLVAVSGHSASGSGDARWYRDSDVLRIAIVAALLDAGLGLAAIRQHIAHLETGGQLVTDMVTITVDVPSILAQIDAYRRAGS